MKRLYSFTIATLLVGTVLFFTTCVNKLAGGTEDVNTKVAGVILNSDNTAAAGAKIHLIPSDFNPLIDTLEKVAISVRADEKGSYCLSVPPAKATYSLEARQADGGRRLLITDITIEGLYDTTFIDTGTLHDPSIIKVDFTGGDFPESGYLYIPGTSISVFIDFPETGLGVIDSVAVGDIPALCFAATTSAPPDTLRRNISIVPGDTALVKNPGWRYRALVRINTAAAQVSADLTDFPLLVRLNGDNFDFSHCAPFGSDLRVTKMDNTPMVFEIERWDVEHDGNDVAEIWVRLDTVRADDSLQAINLYWGRADAQSESNGAAVFDTAHGFRGVWHLNEDPSDGDTPIRDRTANGFNGLPLGSMTNENTVTGVIGTALKYDGVDDNVSVGECNCSGNYSLSCWIYFDDLDTAFRCIWKEYSYTLWYHSAVNGVRVEHFTERGIWAGFYQDGGTERGITAGSWFFLTGTYDGNRIRLFVNGTLLDSTQVITDLPVQSKEPLLLGGRAGELVRGVMDEVRIENRARSPEWVRLCFENQRPGSTIVTIEK